MATYATLTEVLASYPESSRPEEDSDIAEEITNLLTDMTDAVIEEISYDFFSHPENPEYEEDEVHYYDGKGATMLHVHGGIIELSEVAVRDHPTSEYQILEDEDWILTQMYRTPRPFDHIALSGFDRACWPVGVNSVRLTGVFGWEAVPANVKRATINWVRQQLSASDSFSGGVVGPEQYGRPIGPNRMPDLVYRLCARESRRYMACST